MTNDMQVVQSINKSMRAVIAHYVEETGRKPDVLMMIPALYDAWRAERIVRGELKPWAPFYEFEGVAIRLSDAER